MHNNAHIFFILWRDNANKNGKKSALKLSTSRKRKKKIQKIYTKMFHQTA